MSNQRETMTVNDIMTQYRISRMTVHRRIKEGKLQPINTSPALYRQHKLLFERAQVESALSPVHLRADDDEKVRALECSAVA